VFILPNLLVNTLDYNLTGKKDTDFENSTSGYLLKMRPDEINMIKEKTIEYINGIGKSV
jgi:hypothetical protein